MSWAETGAPELASSSVMAIVALVTLGFIFIVLLNRVVLWFTVCLWFFGIRKSFQGPLPAGLGWGPVPSRRARM